MTHYNFRVLLAVIVIALATTTSVAQLFSRSRDRPRA